MKKLSDNKKLDCFTDVRNDDLRHAELVSASQTEPSPEFSQLASSLRILPSAWLLALNGNSAFCRRAKGSLQKYSSLGSQSAPKGRENKLLCATPTPKSTKSSSTSTGRATCVKHIPAPFKSSPTFTGRATCVKHIPAPFKFSPTFTGRATCVKHIPAPFKFSPTFTGRATCVAHDKNLSTYRLNVLETDKNPTLSRICKFAFSSLTNSTLSQRERVKYGFTLAEVLITLGIIGVVAALTLPTLIGNYQKQALATQTKKFYSMMSQAVKQYMADEGVDDLRNTPLASDNYEDTASPEAIESVRNFVTKYLKVVEECDHEANNCFAEKYKSWDGEEKDVFFKQNNYDNRRDYVLSNGSIIRIGYYYNEFPIDLYVDVNGKKGPNRVGYDLWSMSIFYDGSIDEGGVTPDCKQGKVSEFESLCYDGFQNNNTPQEARENRFEGCKVGSYGGCFGHFLENNFTFVDY